MFYTLFLVCVQQLGAQGNTADYNSLSIITEGLSAPGRMAVDTDDNVYVTDAVQKNIVKFDAQGNYIGTITTDFNPISIAINKNNQLFAGDKATGNIYKVSQNGNKSLFHAGATLPNSMVFGLDILYITDSKQNKVIGLDVSGSVVTDFTYETFVFPTGIAFDPHNNYILVAEHGGIGEDMECGGGGSMSWSTTGPQTSLYIFNLDGSFVSSFGCFGKADGLFQRIQGITVGPCGNYYAVDPYLGRVSVFDNYGNYLTKFGLQGDGAGELNLPMDIVFTSDNRSFISSMNKGAVDVFSITGTLPTADFFYDANRMEVQFISDATNADAHYWEFGDGSTSTKENPIHTYAKKGSYVVTYTALSNYCQTSQKTESIQARSKDTSEVIVIYPNPSHGEFTLKITPVAPILTDICTEITSLSGQTIYSEVFNPTSATSFDGSIYRNIIIESFTKGIYIININAGNFAEQEKLILKD